MTEKVQPIDEEKQAIDRIARTGDGELLHRYLRRELEHVVLHWEAGALFGAAGRRSLARDLMALMREGIERGGRRDEPILDSGYRQQPRRGPGQRRVTLDGDDYWGVGPTFPAANTPNNGSDSGSSDSTGTA